MHRTHRLSLLAVLATIVVLLLGYGVYASIRRLVQTKQAVPAASPTPAVEAGALSDRDADGLSDLVENIYHTNPDAADTDKDGAKDGEEVAAGRNPALAGPNDKLPDVPLASGKIDTSTLTGKYLASLPADLGRAQILDKTRIEAFVEEHTGELLPKLPDGAVKVSAAAGKEAVRKYLDAISSTTNPALTLVTSSQIEAAWRASYADPNNSQLRDVRTTLEKNLTILKTVEAPAEARALHEKLVAATQALVANVELLEHMSNDFIAGVMGAKNIELLGSVFQDMASQIAALEAHYGLK